MALRSVLSSTCRGAVRSVVVHQTGTRLPVCVVSARKASTTALWLTVHQHRPSSLLSKGSNVDPKFTRHCSSMSMSQDKDIIFRQFLEYKSNTYTYLLADSKTKECILIDPVFETVERDLKKINEFGLTLKYAVNTHCHADHVTGTGELKKLLTGCKSMISKDSGAKADIYLSPGDSIVFGKHQLECRATPGHTDGCMAFVWHEKEMVFTGDALLIRGCGRTDFQAGNSDVLYDSVHKQIFSLPDFYKVYPAHDYTGNLMSTVGEEKKFNPRLTKTKTEFKKIMDTLGLPYPKQIDKALPANMVCGMYDVPCEK